MIGLFGKKKKGPEQLFYTTDLHCHVLPGIDDGSADVAESIELIGEMKRWGIKRILATPHVAVDLFDNTPASMSASMDELRRGLTEAGCDIEISNSAEYRIDGNFLALLNRGEIVPLPNNYLLIENPFIQEPLNLDNIIFEVSMKGYRPIMAHPERFTYYYDKEHRRRYDELHESGALFQVNLLSLAGFYGKPTKRVAEELVEKGYVDFLGTDLHHSNHVKAIGDYLASKDYLKHRVKLEKTVKNDTAFV